MEQSQKPIVVGTTGASGMPVLLQCLSLIHKAQRRAVLVLTNGAVLTMRQEMGLEAEQLAVYADAVYAPENIGAPPASGSWPAAGMLIVPCSMKTVAGIHSGYSDNLLLRAADVTLKEHRPLVLAARETPLSPIHLKNMYELAMIPSVHIMPLMMTFYHHPKTTEEMVYHIAAKLVEPFGVPAEEYRRWQGI
ncbi:MAG: UbiX family flavin prenyltransferase [Ruthenibacterium sp.]